MQASGGADSDNREECAKLGAWLLHDVVPLLEEMVAVSYPLRKPALAEPVHIFGDAFQPDDLGKGMVSELYRMYRLSCLAREACARCIMRLWQGKACALLPKRHQSSCLPAGLKCSGDSASADRASVRQVSCAVLAWCDLRGRELTCMILRSCDADQHDLPCANQVSEV